VVNVLVSPLGDERAAGVRGGDAGRGGRVTTPPLRATAVLQYPLARPAQDGV